MTLGIILAAVVGLIFGNLIGLFIAGCAQNYDKQKALKSGFIEINGNFFALGKLVPCDPEKAEQEDNQ